jgi:hypothetical protein
MGGNGVSEMWCGVEVVETHCCWEGVGRYASAKAV